MIAAGMASKMLGGAMGTLAAVAGGAAGIARHAAWYVSYRVNGTAHEERVKGPGQREGGTAERER
jgi:hypothetical protein